MSKVWTIVALTNVTIPAAGQEIIMDVEVASTKQENQWEMSWGTRTWDEGKFYWGEWTKVYALKGTQEEAMQAALEIVEKKAWIVDQTITGILRKAKFRVQDYIGKTADEVRGYKMNYPERKYVQARLEYGEDRGHKWLKLEIEKNIVTGKILNLDELL